jgi:hypothetical protein
MMGGGAFILLKVGDPWPESTKQAEIRLASLLKILYIAWRKPLAKDRKDMQWLYSAISAGYG